MIEEWRNFFMSSNEYETVMVKLHRRKQERKTRRRRKEKEKKGNLLNLKCWPNRKKTFFGWLCNSNSIGIGPRTTRRRRIPSTLSSYRQIERQVDGTTNESSGNNEMTTKKGK
jgi:hypothetical protein